MIRTLAVLAGGFLGFAGALMIAMEPPGGSPESAGGYAYDTAAYRDQDGGQYEAELDQRPASVVVDAFADNAARSQGLNTPPKPNVSSVQGQGWTPDRTSDLYRVQFELARIDCFDGAIDGRWSLKFHERLAHVALTQELDFAALASVDEVLVALRTAVVGICDESLQNQAAQLDDAAIATVNVAASSRTQRTPVKQDVLRARGAIDRELPDQFDHVANDAAQVQAVSAYRQLDAFVARDEAPAAEAEATPVPIVPVSEPLPYKAPLLIERHADAYALNEDRVAVELVPDDTSGEPEIVIETEARVVPTVGVEATEVVIAAPVLDTSNSTVDLSGGVVADVNDIDVAAPSRPSPEMVVVAAVSPQPGVLPSIPVMTSRVTPVIPLPVRRNAALVRVFGADAATTNLSEAAASGGSANRLRRRSRARSRVGPARTRPKAVKAKVTPKAPGTSGKWKNNRSAIFRPRG